MTPTTPEDVQYKKLENEASKQDGLYWLVLVLGLALIITSCHNSCNTRNTENCKSIMGSNLPTEVKAKALEMGACRNEQ